MELDELKKSWNALNEQLQKEPIADEQQITELIAGYKANTRKSLGRLVVIQRFSIGMGAVGLAALRLQWAAARQDCRFTGIHRYKHPHRHVVGLENIPLEQGHAY